MCRSVKETNEVWDTRRHVHGVKEELVIGQREQSCGVTKKNPLCKKQSRKPGVVWSGGMEKKNKYNQRKEHKIGGKHGVC